ncbi:MAG: lamin tail domain-containing protein [Candidatus Marinimicrobia bacterium]|nr:lamin tail domain-containing protein [Candidatus Neomarinimicrobiota bacterium]
MKKRISLTWLILWPSLFLAAQDHIVISEIVLQPGSSTASNAEYIKLYNPTDNPVDLSNYYLTDGTDTTNQKYYYNLPTGSNFWSGNGSDFIARFPQGYSIAAQSEIIIAATTTSAYQTYYGTLPDLSIKDSLRQAIDGQTTKGGAFAYLDNAAETLILFYWDGSSPTVQDVDYVIWGSKICAVDKSGVSGYQNDTPIAQQTYAPTHVDGQKLQRISDEGSEPSSGGNGLTGHNETGENLNQTWRAVSVGNTKPKLSNIIYTPGSPVVGQSITFSANVTDDGTIATVKLIYTFQSVTDTVSMSLTTGSTYTATVGPFTTAEALYYKIKAEDTTGLISVSNLYTIMIQEPPEVLTIRTIRDNWSDWNGKTVSLNGVMSIGSNVLRTDRTSAYMQDISGSGLNLFDYNITNLLQGDSIEITGTLEEYQGVIELTGWFSSYTVITNSVPIPAVQEIPISALNDAPSYWEGAYFQINGTVAERADNVGGGSNIIIEDVTGRTTVRLWNSTNVLFNSLGQLVNNYLDSLLQVGNMVFVKGVGSLYKSAPQILLGYASDVGPWIPGEPGAERTIISTAPYPFVPQLGEVIKYTYEYPSNCRAIVRVYDMSGRFITTLDDNYYALSWSKDNTWDGRNELNQLVPPGTYLLHLETTNRTTGKTKVDIAPVVIGVKF